MSWKKTYECREKWPDHSDVLTRTSDEVIERCLERLGLGVSLLHTVYSLEERQQHRTAGHLPTELCAKRCEYRVMRGRLIGEKGIHGTPQCYVLFCDLSGRELRSASIILLPFNHLQGTKGETWLK
jgi:hypothetical protein